VRRRQAPSDAQNKCEQTRRTTFCSETSYRFHTAEHWEHDRFRLLLGSALVDRRTELSISFRE
jgi:hypothetical protein